LAAFPLLDQVDYIVGDNSDKFELYKKQLSDFFDKSNHNEYIKILKKYVEKCELKADLLGSKGCFDEEEKIREYNKTFIRFVVRIDGHDINLDEEPSIKLAWTKINSPSSESKKNELHYDTGEFGGKDDTLRDFPKLLGNAKLLSSNARIHDFVYSGRFVEEKGIDAFSINKLNSLKVQSVLNYLIDKIGLKIDTQVILTWAIDGSNKIAQPYGSSRDLMTEWWEYDTVETDNDKVGQAEATIDIDYAIKIKKALLSYHADITKHSRKVAVLVLDAATSGRVSVTFYQEFDQDQYHKKIVDWHNTVKWEIPYWQEQIDNKGKVSKKFATFVGCPSIDDIIVAVYGKKRGNSDKSYDKIKKNARERLIHCIFAGQVLPYDMVVSSAMRASNPLSTQEWEKTLAIACAIYYKHYNNKKKEVLLMELQDTRMDRDYLYGRLLAVADKIEQVARYKQGKTSKDDARPTVAMRYMSAFVTTPFKTWGVISKEIRPYQNMLNGAEYYQKQIDDILSLSQSDFESNVSLSPLYLLGYSAQRKVLNAKKESKEDNEVTPNK